MGNTLPSKAIDRVAWFENHTPVWQTVATGIGTTAGAVTSLATLTAAARAAFNAQQLAYDQARAATQTFHDAVRAMSNAGTDILKAVKAKAAVDGNGVYALALIPAPALPTPLPPPGTPAAFTAALNPDGSLKLKWKCANPPGSSGTIYQVARRTGATGAFTTIGGSGTRSFTDATVPAGAATVTYEIRAVRSTAVGTAAQFVVNFGVGEGTGTGTATVASAPKLAA